LDRASFLAPRYTFTVTDFHRLPFAGLPAHPSTTSKPEVRNGHRFIQLVQAPPTDAAKEKPPEGCKAWSFQSTLADCRAWKSVEHRLEQLFFALWARTPLAIIAHRLPGRRVVIRPTLRAIGSISAARYHGADAFLRTVETDVHRTTTADSDGEGWGCNC